MFFGKLIFLVSLLYGYVGSTLFLVISNSLSKRLCKNSPLPAGERWKVRVIF